MFSSFFSAAVDIRLKQYHVKMQSNSLHLFIHLTNSLKQYICLCENRKRKQNGKQHEEVAVIFLVFHEGCFTSTVSECFIFSCLAFTLNVWNIDFKFITRISLHQHSRPSFITLKDRCNYSVRVLLALFLQNLGSKI